MPAAPMRSAMRATTAYAPHPLLATDSDARGGGGLPAGGVAAVAGRGSGSGSRVRRGVFCVERWGHDQFLIDAASSG